MADTAAMTCRAALLTLALTLACTSAAPASPSPPVEPLAVANAAWPTSPCAGRLIVTFDAAVGARGHAEEATGILAWTDRPWELRTCDLLVDPAGWVTADPESRCLILVHGAGHLDGRDHPEGGVMASPPVRGSVPACLTVRARIIRDIAARAGAGGHWSCSPWQGRVLPCVVYRGDREVRYRARVRGNAYAISRARAPRRPWWATQAKVRQSHRG